MHFWARLMGDMKILVHAQIGAWLGSSTASFFNTKATGSDHKRATCSFVSWLRALCGSVAPSQLWWTLITSSWHGGFGPSRDQRYVYNWFIFRLDPWQYPNPSSIVVFSWSNHAQDTSHSNCTSIKTLLFSASRDRSFLAEIEWNERERIAIDLSPAWLSYFVLCTR